MKPLEFLDALIDDITGRDANGRDAAFKREYSAIMTFAVCPALAGFGALAFFPWGAIPGTVLFARKLWLHLTNSF